MHLLVCITWSPSTVSLHDTIPSYGTWLFPRIRVNRKMWLVDRVSWVRDTGWKGISAGSIFEPSDYPIRAQQTSKTTFTLWDYECVTVSMHLSCFETCSYILTKKCRFCRIDIKPRNTPPVMLDCSQYALLDSKSITDAMVFVCRKLLRNLSQ